MKEKKKIQPYKNPETIVFYTGVHCIKNQANTGLDLQLSVVTAHLNSSGAAVKILSF